MLIVRDLPRPSNDPDLDGATLDTVFDVCCQRQLLAADETVVKAGWLAPTGRGNPAAGTARLTVQLGPVTLAGRTAPDGWLFFGWASR
ncbi:hypothetical protein [Actinoplanes awajinensis]|uniref:Uncharacterized protein n=1 Tax=Actinoplanes awajinensis subsp. mycoplanecinus TaxID=135947 RepID=A0A117MR95_9ACTN|nr:hypothetical protein [Actinoplanes awajinensis]KUL31420.1 hypothetical protein ADL15_22040 [Actinoplanes awajinensis subsp. mycoplanecinus]